MWDLLQIDRRYREWFYFFRGLDFMGRISVRIPQGKGIPWQKMSYSAKGDIFYSPGKKSWTRDRQDTKARILRPAINPPMVQPRMVSLTSIRKKRLIAQKPESFGRERPIPPAQMAMAQRTGETEEAAMVELRIAAVVIRETVVEPCAQRMI